MICRKCSVQIAEAGNFCPHCGAKQIVSLKHNVKQRGNGQGTVYKLPNGKYKAEVVLGYYADETGTIKKRRRTKTFAKKKDVIAALPALKNEYIAIDDISFQQLYAFWSQKHYQHLSKSKETAYKIAYKKCETLHWRKVSGIKTFDMQSVVDERGASYYTKRDIKLLMHLMWKYAIQNDFCAKNYAEFIELPPLEKPKKDAFTSAEIESLWDDYQSNEFTGYVLIMIYTGMRYGEIAQIEKQNVHLEEQYMIGGIKTDAGKNRMLPINNKILPIVKRLYMKCHSKLLEMSEDRFRKLYKDMISRTKIRPLSPHCCRHTFITLMTQANTNVAIMKETAGHKNYSTTLEYTHIRLQEKLDAVNKL